MLSIAKNACAGKPQGSNTLRRGEDQRVTHAFALQADGLSIDGAGTAALHGCRTHASNGATTGCGRHHTMAAAGFTTNNAW
ncbi:hypothetical protein IA54_019850 [Xanthomonas phaseoli pv. syngonii LMG 9055]|uniref:Uncharacterized protein n=1 Tax=Xanthomonas phaseoli pv. syngonii LMG 9055 TaxID=1437878 RepID=A0A1V9HJI8_9XANT|nr:hypothetical protein IA54_019850 [Xanthomonas phaseoli pv. syngonii LMG 9055]